MIRLPLVMIVSVLLVADAAAKEPSADTWTGFFGPNRDGWVKGFQPPKVWPKDLKRVWQATVGASYATPLVAGGRIYQHARQGEQEVVLCLDLKTGDVQWKKSYRTPFKIGGGAQYHGKGPKSSPALADGRLFTMSITGVLTAWDAKTGKRLWRRDESQRFGKGHPYWGSSTSPLIDGKRVIVHFGGDKQGALFAFDSKTGKEVWKQGSAGQSYASPILVEIDGVRQVVELNMEGLTGVESKTGKLLWSYPYPQVETDQNMVMPTFHKGLIIQGGENRGILAIEPKREEGEWTVSKRWHQKKAALDMSAGVMNDGLFYGLSHYDSGRFFCLDPKTGQVLWFGPPRMGDHATFLAVPGYVLALRDNGMLEVFKADKTGYKQAASWRVAKGDTWTPPVLLSDGILTKDKQTLTLWSLSGS